MPYLLFHHIDNDFKLRFSSTVVASNRSLKSFFAPIILPSAKIIAQKNTIVNMVEQVIPFF